MGLLCLILWKRRITSEASMQSKCCYGKQRKGAENSKSWLAKLKELVGFGWHVAVRVKRPAVQVRSQRSTSSKQGNSLDSRDTKGVGVLFAFSVFSAFAARACRTCRTSVRSSSAPGAATLWIGARGEGSRLRP